MDPALPGTMRKYLGYILSVPLVLLALTPPWNISVTCDFNGLPFLWSTFLAGFLVAALFYIRVNVCLKLFVLWCFIGCFTSKAPYMSFAAFFSVIACVYYYVACRFITDWRPVFKAVQAIFLLICLLIVLQSFGLDTLLNFNMKDPCVLGTIGNKMVLGSFACVLAPFVIYAPVNWAALCLIAFISMSSGAVLSLFAGFAYWYCSKIKRFSFGIAVAAIYAVCMFAFSTGDLKVFTGPGRGPVWARTASLAIHHPQGHGIATYKLLFPLYSQDLEASHANHKWTYENTKGDGLAWRRTHNCWLQVLFETGIPGFLLLLGFVLSIVRKSYKDPRKLTGLIIIGVDMLTHFPTRMMQSVPLIIMYLAWCEIGENDGAIPLH